MSDLQSILEMRFWDAPDVSDEGALIGSMLARGSCRRFRDVPVSDGTLSLLCAAAMSAPSKSDLQQRDIVVIKSPEVRQSLVDLVSDQTWVAGAPIIAVFCGNNRRQRLLHDWHGVPFANDHLDAFFNAACDAAVALAAFVTAAEALGLGCCPISAVRNEAGAVSELLGLPDHVFPFAGLAIGHPEDRPEVSPRLPLGQTCHIDRYQETGLKEAVQAYDARREAAQPYAAQRFVERFGESASYGWSQDKVRQYSAPEREGFGQFVRAKGFCLD